MKREREGGRGRCKESRWMMLLDSISCPTVPPAIGHAAGVCVCVCVQIHRVVFVFQMEKGVCVWVCMHTCYPRITKSETCVFVCVCV